MIRRMLGRVDVVLFLCCFAVVISYAATAHAYLDAGTGSMLLQVLVATIAGGLLTMKLYWRRIKAAFARGPINDEGAAPDSPTDGDE